MDRFKQRVWKEHVRVDEDEHVALGMVGPSVSGVCNALHRLVYHRRAIAPGD